MSKKEPLQDVATRIAVINFRGGQYLIKDLQSGKVVEVIGEYLKKSADKREKLTAGAGEFVYKHPGMARFYLVGRLEPAAADRVMTSYNMTR